jgi:transcriptional/translational regulatory protein YebC/TACO1
VGAAVRAAALAGGADPATNTALKDALAAARAAAVPLSIVQRNIDRATGKAGDVKEVLIGAVVGPARLLIQGATDSAARLTSDVRTAVNKAGGGAKMTAGGGAGLGFERVAVVAVSPLAGSSADSGDDVVAAAADAGAEDVVPRRPGGGWRVVGAADAYGRVRDAVAALPGRHVVAAESGLEFVATAPVRVAGEERDAVDGLVARLMGCPDVDAVWTTVEEEGEEEEEGE